MNTPICDFIDAYVSSGATRLHMPGHKGAGVPEAYDITEFTGADSLYEADGIIRQSEENAAALFGAARTLYSAEGSSQCIRAMLYLTRIDAARRGRPYRVLAGRNAHRVYSAAAAFAGMETDWLLPEAGGPLSGRIPPEAVEEALQKESYAAVYLTSPDYLGGMADVAGIAAVCRRYDTPLYVDNAHGAYLRFLQTDRHPLTLGADVCCDSAHKTLPVLTGGAYLHFADSAAALIPQAKNAMALFGSTSPSYLILRSLDAVNPQLAGPFPAQLQAMCRRLAELRAALAAAGYGLAGEEPAKLTLAPGQRGLTGTALAALLEQNGFMPEYADRDYTVMMFSPANGEAALPALADFLLSLPAGAPISADRPPLSLPPQRIRPLEALLSEGEEICTQNSIGRICAAPGVGCPPGVPMVRCGEEITPQTAALMRYYGMETVRVVKEKEAQ